MRKNEVDAFLAGYAAGYKKGRKAALKVARMQAYSHTYSSQVKVCEMPMPKPVRPKNICPG